MKIRDFPKYVLYDNCEYIAKFIKNGEDFPDFLGLTNTKSETLICLTKPGKFSLLHELIQALIILEIDDIKDNMFSEENTIAELCDILKVYNIVFLNQLEFKIGRNLSVNDDGETQEGDSFNDLYLDYLIDIYREKLLPILIEETFTTLFFNRQLMCEFNRNLSEFICELNYSDHPKILQKDGVVVRFVEWPTWVRRALAYRESGKCALCSADISGTIATLEEKEIQIDHIIALENGGSNDITNLQMLCKKCHEEKTRNTEITTSGNQPIFYELD